MAFAHCRTNPVAHQAVGDPTHQAQAHPALHLSIHFFQKKTY
jgi:hypothetical protein